MRSPVWTVLRPVVARTSRTVRRALTARHVYASPSPTLVRAHRLRNVLGVVGVGAATLAWRHDQLSAGANAIVEATLETAAGSVVLIFVPCALLVLAARGSRGQMLRMLRVPVVTVLATVAAYAVLFGALVGLTLFARSAHGTATLLALPLLPVMLVFGTSLVVGVPLIVRDFFRAADGHPWLPGLMIASWSVVSIVTGCFVLADGLDPHYPQVVAVLLLFLGPVLNLGLAAWEMSFFARRGISIGTTFVPP